MRENFADRLQNAIKQKGAPICVGIDPIYSRLPADIAEHRDLNDESDSEAALDAVLEFSRQVIRIVAPIVPAVKINSAFFERYYWEGIEAYYDLLQEAAGADLIVIGDSKRGDIGSTAELYAKSALSDPDFTNLDDLVGPDAITVNGFSGLDGVKPFIDVAETEQKGVFVWLRPTNDSAATLHDVKLESGQTFSEHFAGQLAQWASDESYIGRGGYSFVGAVVGAKNRDVTAKLRGMLPQSFFLVPGYGAQGTTAQDIVSCFKSDGTGALITASRSVIYAYEDMKYMERFTSEWEKCVEAACKDLVTEVNTAIQEAVAAQAG